MLLTSVIIVLTDLHTVHVRALLHPPSCLFLCCIHVMESTKLDRCKIPAVKSLDGQCDFDDPISLKPAILGFIIVLGTFLTIPALKNVHE
ncbi:hypothetical protein F4808DRAFT_431993 [Astrocystis sublimbata]|nr:hypothetical protein F4808DRAFT_431993 [Astrocystis sublimbata]